MPKPEFWSPYIGVNNIYIAGDSQPCALHYLDGGIMLCRLYNDEQCPACEAEKDDLFSNPDQRSDFRAYARSCFPIIDADSPSSEVRLWYAGPKIALDIEIKRPYVTIIRSGQGLFTQYEVRRRENYIRPPRVIRAMRIIEALASVAVLPKLEYPPLEEVVERFNLKPYNEPYGGLTNLDPIPEQQPREFCIGCGRDTTDDLPLAQCLGCLSTSEPACAWA